MHEKHGNDRQRRGINLPTQKAHKSIILQENDIEWFTNRCLTTFCLFICLLYVHLILLRCSSSISTTIVFIQIKVYTLFKFYGHAKYFIYLTLFAFIQNSYMHIYNCCLIFSPRSTLPVELSCKKSMC